MYKDICIRLISIVFVCLITVYRRKTSLIKIDKNRSQKRDLFTKKSFFSQHSHHFSMHNIPYKLMGKMIQQFSHHLSCRHASKNLRDVASYFWLYSLTIILNSLYTMINTVKSNVYFTCNHTFPPKIIHF